MCAPAEMSGLLYLFWKLLNRIIRTGGKILIVRTETELAEMLSQLEGRHVLPEYERLWIGGL